jgi:hypothetical protein
MATTSFLTPDNSVIGQTRKAPDEFDEDHITKRPRMDIEISNSLGDEGHAQNLSVGVNELLQPPSPASIQQLAEVRNDVAPRFEPQGGGNLSTQPASDETSFEQLTKNGGDVFYLCKSGKIYSLLWRQLHVF